MEKRSGIIVDPVARIQFPGTLIIDQGRIVDILPDPAVEGPFILPGLIDSHIHIESSMLTPAAFAAKAVCHGTVAVVADPHEIANVLGIAGIDFMIANGRQAPLKRDDIHFLAEMMNFPGVINRDPEVMAKLSAAAKMGKRVDGHGPGLRGDALAAYAKAGISTDHESGTLEECYEKLGLGMKIMLRQGSSARDFEVLHPLITSHSGQCMLCTDDIKPADLARGHINLLIKEGLRLGHDIFDLLQCGCVNPVRHYRLDVGLLQQGDPADFIVVDDLERMEVRAVWINGEMFSDKAEPLFEAVQPRAINHFNPAPLTAGQLRVEARGARLKVIEVTDGQIVTGAGEYTVPVGSALVEPDPATDLLKILVLNRYAPAPPAIGFVRGFGLKHGAMASSIAHDSHNLIAIGSNDADLARAVHLLAESGGGICFVQGEEERLMALPVAGLMGLDSCEEMARNYSVIEQRVKQNGCILHTPFMTMAFLALPVIPALKITDLGLFDGKRFALTDLFV